MAHKRVRARRATAATRTPSTRGIKLYAAETAQPRRHHRPSGRHALRGRLPGPHGAVTTRSTRWAPAAWSSWAAKVHIDPATRTPRARRGSRTPESAAAKGLERRAPRILNRRPVPPGVFSWGGVNEQRAGRALPPSPALRPEPPPRAWENRLVFSRRPYMRTTGGELAVPRPFILANFGDEPAVRRRRVAARVPMDVQPPPWKSPSGPWTATTCDWS